MGFYAKRINEFHIGHWIISKVQWTMSAIIFLKLFNVAWWVYAIVVPALLIVVWIIGLIVHKSGLWDNFVKENLRGIKNIGG